MSEHPPLAKTRPVQGSEWMIAVRDSEIDLTLAEWALGTLYGTNGNWGQKAYPADRWIAQRLHTGRDKIRTTRESLIAKGLLENIGLAPNGQHNQFMYRLTLPVEMLARRTEGDAPQTDTPSDARTALYGGGGPI